MKICLNIMLARVVICDESPPQSHLGQRFFSGECQRYSGRMTTMYRCCCLIAILSIMSPPCLRNIVSQYPLCGNTLYSMQYAQFSGLFSCGFTIRFRGFMSFICPYFSESLNWLSGKISPSASEVTLKDMGKIRRDNLININESAKESRHARFFINRTVAFYSSAMAIALRMNCGIFFI